MGVELAGKHATLFDLDCLSCLTDDIISALLHKAALDKFFNPHVSLHLLS